jgi:hypothetical protein
LIEIEARKEACRETSICDCLFDWGPAGKFNLFGRKKGKESGGACI